VKRLDSQRHERWNSTYIWQGILASMEPRGYPIFLIQASSITLRFTTCGSVACVISYFSLVAVPAEGYVHT